MTKRKKQIVPDTLAKLEINNNGELIFPEVPFVLSPKDIIPDDCDAALIKYKAKDDWDVGAGFLWKYYNVLFEEMCGEIGLCFNRNSLKLMQIGVELPSVELFDGWPTEKSSREEVKFIQDAFKKHFGGKLKYGQPYHRFDPRSYCAQCGISYGL